ncbi:MAG TPA: hypothetical protein VK980_08830 [Sphingomonas sp.]|nr:hypothetical protein [Sphingomonas sp.]
MNAKLVGGADRARTLFAGKGGHLHLKDAIGSWPSRLIGVGGDGDS